MVTEHLENSMNDTIPATDTEMDERQDCSPVPEKRSYYGLFSEMPCLCGESSSTRAAKKASTVLSSEMSPRTKAANSFDKRATLLIASGLVKGIIPMSIRKELGARMLDIALCVPDGSDADSPKADC